MQVFTGREFHFQENYFANDDDDDGLLDARMSSFW